MTQEHVERLLAACAAATPGPRVAEGVSVWLENGVTHIAEASTGLIPDATGYANAAQIAACDPETIGELCRSWLAMREALRPFAEHAEYSDARFKWKDHESAWCVKGSVTIGDCRRAAELLKGTQ